MKYPPDPSLHTDPEIEKRCPYCHPQARASSELPTESPAAIAKEDAGRRQIVEVVKMADGSTRAIARPADDPRFHRSWFKRMREGRLMNVLDDFDDDR